MTFESPLLAALIFGVALLCVIAHVFVHALMIIDRKAMNRITAKRGVKTIFTNDDMSFVGRALIAANFIGGSIMYGSVISVLIFQPLDKFDIYIEPHFAYVFGFVFYMALIAVVSHPKIAKDVGSNV